MTSLFKKPTLPAMQDPTPLPDEKQTTQARRRRIASEKGASSIQSTILSDAGKETLGS